MSDTAPRIQDSMIVTHRTIAAPLVRVWNNLRFYEELNRKLPLSLRLLPPRAAHVESRVPAVGDETTLQYEGGHYTRRVTKLDPPRLLEFDIVAQRFAADRGIRFHGGAFTLRELAPGQTDLAVTTRYTSAARTGRLARSIETWLCRRLQGHLLDAIQAGALQPVSGQT